MTDKDGGLKAGAWGGVRPAARSPNMKTGPSRSLLGLSMTLVSCAAMMVTGLVGLLGVFGLTALAPLARVLGIWGQPLLAASLALTVLGLARRGARVVVAAALAAALVYSSMYIIPDPEALDLDEMMGMFGSGSGLRAVLSTGTFLSGLWLLVSVFVTAYWPMRLSKFTGVARLALAGLAASVIVFPGLYLAFAAPPRQEVEARAETDAPPVRAEPSEAQAPIGVEYLEAVPGYRVELTWGQPGGDYGLLLAIPSDPTLKELLATGEQLNRAFADEARITVMIFDDPQAAGVFFDSMMGGGSSGDEAESTSRWKGTYEKNSAESVHRIEVWLDPELGPFETVDYDSQSDGS